MTEAHAWFDVRYQAVFDTTFYDDAKWAFPGSRDLVEASPNPDPVTPASTRSMIGARPTRGRSSAPKNGCPGQYYLMTIQDKDGKAFDGAAAYRLRVPPEVPVTLYWSATVYDRTTHTLLRGTCPEPVARRTVPAAHRGRRIGRRLLRTRTSRRVRRELGPDPQRRPLRGALPLLRTPEALLRQNVETPRHRTGSLNRRQPRTASPSAGLGVESGTGARQPPRFVASLWLVEGAT